MMCKNRDRLVTPPALWLSEGFAYRQPPGDEDEDEDNETVPLRQYSELDFRIHLAVHPLCRDETINDCSRILGNRRYWPAVLLRTIFSLLPTVFIVLGVGHLVVDHQFSGDFNLALLMQHLLYQSFVVMTLGITIAYICLDQDSNVIITCINAWWYTT